MMDAHSEERLALVCSVLANKIRAAAAAVPDVGMRVVQGLRTVAEQDADYAKGRTIPPIGKEYIVTNVRGGYSYHNFGLAVDCVPGVPGVTSWEPDWNEFEEVTDGDGRTYHRMKDHWLRMISACRAQGLNCGADWVDFKDFDHFQLTGKYPVDEPPSELREIAAAQGLAAGWKAAGLIAAATNA